MKKATKRRLLAGLLAAALSLPLLFLPAGAVGDGNIDGGNGGGMGAGSKQNYWNNEDGVRITILKNGQKVYSMDWSNQPEAPSVKCFFAPRNKLDYLHGASLRLISGDNSYRSTVVSHKMPTIIGGAGGSSIDAIRRYFTDKDRIQAISNGVGIPYGDLTGGEYKLLLEPVAYFTYKGVKWAMTATEAAMYDAQVDGQLRAWMKSLTHQNLPLSMFLERNDTELHLEAWTGSKNGKQSNANIIHYLGMGVVSFTPQLPPVQDTYDYEFRTDTDVIIAFTITTDDAITPDVHARLTIDIDGQTIQRTFISPGGEEEQLIWFRWHTPSEPKELEAYAHGHQVGVTLKIKVSDLEEQTPPDPTFFDRNNGFTLQETPDYGSNLSTTWGEWKARWKKTGPGRGYWEWYYVNYEAALDIHSFELTPDANCPTAYRLANGRTTMKSGYAVEVSVEPLVKRGYLVSEYDVTEIQNGVATFPEFGYEEYDRLLERVDSRHLGFKKNPFSYYGSRIHYTPLWYPDNVDYPVAVCVFDAWTPGGQLYATLSDSVDIFDACLNDWYIHETDEED